MSRSRSRRKRSSGRRSPNSNNANTNSNSSTNDGNAGNEGNDGSTNDGNEGNDGSANDGNANDGNKDIANGSSRTASRFATETKRATQTTEFIAYLAAVVGVVMTALQVDEDPAFGAEQAWLYITILTLGYMVSRGLAKAGSRAPSDVFDGTD